MSTPPYEELLKSCPNSSMDCLKKFHDSIITNTLAGCGGIWDSLQDLSKMHLLRWMWLNYNGGNHHGKIRNILVERDCDPVVYRMARIYDLFCFRTFPLSQDREDIVNHLKEFTDFIGCNSSYAENVLRMIRGNIGDYELILDSQPIVTAYHMSQALGSFIFPERWPEYGKNNKLIQRHELLAKYVLEAPPGRISDSDREKFQAYHTWLNGRTMTRELATIADDYFLGQGELK